MRQNSLEGGFLSTLLKSVILSVLLTLSAVLIFSAVVKSAGLDSNVIKWVNQFIKVVSVFVGCFFSVHGKLGLVKGGLSGILYSVVVFTIFALIAGVSPFGAQLIIDCLFTCAIGAISGVIAVNRKTV